MSSEDDYTREKLIELYREKTEELGHIPMAKEISNDPDMPAYITYLREFGTGDEIIRSANLENKYKRPARINNQFCNDCVYDPRTCGCEIEECMKRAELYFRYLGKKLNI